MITLTQRIPRSVTIAFSGGVDSVAVAHFLNRNHDIKLLFVHHRTKTSEVALPLVYSYAKRWKVPLDIHTISNEQPSNTSKEEFWRNERYRIFHALNEPVITCHHLDDCVETWVWSSMHGCGKIIPHNNGNVIRPFLSTRKANFVHWCNRHNLLWAEDSSNTDTAYTRNYIRHEMMPHVLQVNPGIHKTIRKKVLENV